MTRRALALACALLTASVGVARAADRAGEAVTPVERRATSSIGRSCPRPRRASVAALVPASSSGPSTADRPRALIDAVSGVAGRYFPWLGGQVAIVPDAALDRLARRPEVAAISLDRTVRGTMERTTSSTGARWVTEHLGVTGAGVGVATIDSGVNAWHEDLDGRVVHFADFVNAQSFAYDDYGHGTHVAGIIAGGGQRSTARGAAWRPARTSSC